MIKYYEFCFTNESGFCIKAMSQPTLESAIAHIGIDWCNRNECTKENFEGMNEITRQEAIDFYDSGNIDNWEILV